MKCDLCPRSWIDKQHHRRCARYKIVDRIFYQNHDMLCSNALVECKLDTKIVAACTQRNLIMTVGLPRSGKSTWVKQQIQYGYPVVNPDSIRLAIHGQRYVAEREGEVWRTAMYMVNALFLVGHPVVILDATNMELVRRNEWLEPNRTCLYKVFDTPADVCKQRAIDTGMEDLVPVIEQMERSKDPLTPDELERLVVEEE